MPETTTQDATPEAASSTTPTPTPATTTEAGQPQETFPREYVEQLRAENAKWRTKAREEAAAKEQATKDAERAKMDETQRLQAELADAKQQIASAEAERQKAIVRANLTAAESPTWTSP